MTLVSGNEALCLGAVVVDFHAADLAADLIEALSVQGVNNVVVVDNSATGTTRRILGVAEGDRFKIIETTRNRGFGGGVNLGMEELGPDIDIVIVANPDTTPSDGAVATLSDALARDPALAIVGPALFEATGQIHQSARAFPSLRASTLQAALGLLLPRSGPVLRYRQRNWQHSSEPYVDWVSGAFFAVRREAFEQVGGFDPSYFMYVEEVDLCWRLRQAGWRVGYRPEAHVTHVGGASGATRPYRMLFARHASLWRFAHRTATGPDRWLLPVAALGILARLAIAVGLAFLKHLSTARPRASRTPDARHA